MPSGQVGRGAYIAVDLCSKLIRRLERTIVAHSLHHVDFDPKVVQVRLRVREEMELTSTCVRAERRAPADVEKPVCPLTIDDRSSEVDPVARQKHLRVESEVCRRVTEGPSDPISRRNAPDQHRRSSEQSAGLEDPAGAKEGPDPRAADRAILDEHVRDTDDVETEILPEALKGRHVGRTALSEAEADTDDDGRDAELVGEDLLRERSRSELSDVGEGSENEMVGGAA